MGKYTTIITDVDGTLYYQTPLRIHMGVWMCSDPLSVGKVLKFRKEREAGNLVEPGLKVRSWMYEKPLLILPRYRDAELIRLLKDYIKDGGKVIAYSDYPAKDKLKVLGFENIHVYDPTDEGITALKPDPQGLNYLLEKEQVDVKKCLFIGDRMEKDGECAKAGGIPYLILSKKRQDRRKQLRKLIQELEGHRD